MALHHIKFVFFFLKTHAKRKIWVIKSHKFLLTINAQVIQAHFLAIYFNSTPLSQNESEICERDQLVKEVIL